MTVRLQLTTASSDLYTYLSEFDRDFPVNNNGAFNGIFGGGDQWYAGASTTAPTAPNGLPSVIMDINDYSYAPGQFNGDVPKLALGSSLVHNVSGDIFVQTDELIVTQQGGGLLPITSTFQEAIYALSHGGAVNGGDYTFTIPGQPPVTQHFDGLTDYFAEQGTNQIGTAANDILLSFAGNDTLTGGAAGVDGDTFLWNADYYDTDPATAVAGWGSDGITDFVDGTELIVFEGFGWANEVAFQSAGGSLAGNVITYANGGITSTITVNFAGAGTLDWSDIVFA